MAELKTYIRGVDLDKRVRSELVFSDATKIRMYDDFQRPGVRLKSTFNKWSKKNEFPTDVDITVRLPSWSPQAVKGWVAFQEVSEKPDGTAVTWRVSDGTNDYWWDGGVWTVVTPLDIEWNTDVEVSANIGSFPFSQRTIQFVARLTTTDVNETPVLRSFSLAILAQFDYWEDLVLRSLVPRLRADFQFIADFAATLPRTTDHFNVKDGNTDFTPEKDWDIVGIDAVYDDTNDPGHDVDLFGSYDSSSGKVTLTGPLNTGTDVFVRLKLQPDIIVNFAHVDYIEVANTPAVVIENMNVKGRKVEAFREIIDLAAEKGYRLQKPFHADTVTFMCSMLVGSIRDSLRMLSTSIGAILSGEQSGQLPCLLDTVALDEKVTMYYDTMARYNPRPNFSHLMTSTFGIVLKDFYVWSESVKETHIVKEFKFSPIIDADVDGPEPVGDPKPLNAGVIPFLLNEPDFEDG